MVIAEALNEIKDLEKARKQIHDRLLGNLFILPDLAEADKPQPLELQLDAIGKLSESIATLKTAITHTNLSTIIDVAGLEGGVTERLNLMQLLKRIESLRLQEKIFSSVAQTIDSKDSRFFSAGRRAFAATATEPIKLLPNFKGTAQSYLDAAMQARKSARHYEQALVKANWRTEVNL